MDFIKTQPDQNLTMDKLRNAKLEWGRNSLRLNYTAEFGYVETSIGTKVDAARLLQNTLTIDFYNQDTGVSIHKPKEFYDQFSFDISFNCFGYCFADSKVFLPNPTAFILDDYEEVKFEDAELIIFKEYQGFNDLGEEIFNYSHAVKKLPSGNVSFKPGINPLVENISRDKAIHTYNFNHEIYLKKRILNINRL